MKTAREDESMPNLYIKETAVEVKTPGEPGCIIGESGVYESFTDDAGKLYRDLVREHGRCTGKMYIDPKAGGKPRHIGWVFLKRRAYEDAPRKTYLAETWVSVHTAKDTVTREEHFATL
jgi:hypothetical protein